MNCKLNRSISLPAVPPFYCMKKGMYVAKTFRTLDIVGTFIKMKTLSEKKSQRKRDIIIMTVLHTYMFKI